VDTTPVRVEMNGVVYRVTRDDDPWADYERDAIHAAIKTSAGTLTADEGKALKAAISQAREEGSRPAVRP
jgi:hypothetical protein